MEWWMYLSVFTSVAAVIGLLVIIFKAGKWVGVIESTKEAFDKFVEKMDQAVADIRREFREDIEKMDQAAADIRREFREDMQDLRKELRATKETSPGSPIRLTDLGKAMSKTLGGKDWATEIAKHLSEQAKGKEPYEIQDISYHYVHKQLEPNEEERHKIGECAYEHGVKREQVLNVLAVELRDILGIM